MCAGQWWATPLFRAGRMVQSVKCLLHKHENLSLDPYDPCEKLPFLLIPLWGRQKQQHPWSFACHNLANQQAPSERPCFKKKKGVWGGGRVSEAGNVHFLPPSTHAPAHKCVHIKVHAHGSALLKYTSSSTHHLTSWENQPEFLLK